jgi:hypothetical protein
VAQRGAPRLVFSLLTSNVRPGRLQVVLSFPIGCRVAGIFTVTEGPTGTVTQSAVYGLDSASQGSGWTTTGAERLGNSTKYSRPKIPTINVSDAASEILR